MSSGTSRRTERNTFSPVGEPDDPRPRILEAVTAVRIHDPQLARSYVQDRQARDSERNDEMWEGVYVVPPLANLPHQQLVGAFTALLTQVIGLPGHGVVYPGANVSDRRTGWEHNYRDPDVVVVLRGSRAIDCVTHLVGGPDFLIEIQSPGDATDEKLPFYSRLGVRELLIVQRDSRRLRLYRHDGHKLTPVEANDKRELASVVVPLAFRRKLVGKQPRMLVRRTDGTAGDWVL